MLKHNTSPPPSNREGQLYKQLDISGRTFAIYYGYYEDADRYSRYNDPMPIYPDFRADPVHDGAGRPFVTYMQDACPHFSPRRRSSEPDCGACRHLEKGAELIGICTCPHNRKNE